MHCFFLALLALNNIALAPGPEAVLLVVNRASPVSAQIGEYYAQRRGIPRSNVCLIDTLPDETISRAVHDKAIAAPVAACLKKRSLVESVLFIVTTLGVPLRISGSGGQQGDQASVDSELAALYEDLHGAPHRLSGPIANPFFRRVLQPMKHPDVPLYLVCRLAAYDVSEVKQMIDRSLEATNRGRVVLDMKSNDDQEGNNWLWNAALLLPKGRFVLDQSTEVVTGERDVIGYAGWGSNDPNRKQRFLGLHWLPGAIATEYVSSDGRTFTRPPDTWTTTTWKDTAHFWAGSPQSLAADYIHEGATGASGHVHEPYLALTPRPDVLFPAYLSGRTLAESFYLAIPAVSWQNIVIGDPLCRLK